MSLGIGGGGGGRSSGMRFREPSGSPDVARRLRISSRYLDLDDPYLAASAYSMASDPSMTDAAFSDAIGRFSGFTRAQALAAQFKKLNRRTPGHDWDAALRTWDRLSDRKRQILYSLGVPDPQRKYADINAGGNGGILGGVADMVGDVFEPGIDVLEGAFKGVKWGGGLALEAMNKPIEAAKWAYRASAIAAGADNALAYLPALALGAGAAAFTATGIGAPIGLAMGAGAAAMVGGLAAQGTIRDVMDEEDRWAYAIDQAGRDGGEKAVHINARDKALDILNGNRLAYEVALDLMASGDPQGVALGVAKRRLRDQGIDRPTDHPKFAETFQKAFEQLQSKKMQDAVEVLTQGKVSPGRDLADSLGLNYQMDPFGGIPILGAVNPYSLVSGAMDFTYTLSADPLLQAGAALKVHRLKRGINDIEEMARAIGGEDIAARVAQRAPEDADIGATLFDSARRRQYQLKALETAGGNQHAAWAIALSDAFAAGTATERARRVAAFARMFPQQSGLLQHAIRHDQMLRAMPERLRELELVDPLSIARVRGVVNEIGPGNANVAKIVEDLGLDLTQRQSDALVNYYKQMNDRMWEQGLGDVAPDAVGLGDWDQVQKYVRQQGFVAELIAGSTNTQLKLSAQFPTLSRRYVERLNVKSRFEDIINKAVQNPGAYFKALRGELAQDASLGLRGARFVEKKIAAIEQTFGRIAMTATNQLPRTKAISIYGPNGGHELMQWLRIHAGYDEAYDILGQFYTAGNAAARRNVVATAMHNVLQQYGVTDDFAKEWTEGTLKRMQRYSPRRNLDLKTIGSGDIQVPMAIHDWQLADDLMVLPSLRDMERAYANRGILRTGFHNLVHSETTDRLMTQYWKPLVLLRLGFIPRAAGEEMLSFVSRMSPRSLLDHYLLVPLHANPKLPLDSPEEWLVTAPLRLLARMERAWRHPGYAAEYMATYETRKAAALAGLGDETVARITPGGVRNPHYASPYRSEKWRLRSPIGKEGEIRSPWARRPLFLYDPADIQWTKQLEDRLRSATKRFVDPVKHPEAAARVAAFYQARRSPGIVATYMEGITGTDRMLYTPNEIYGVDGQDLVTIGQPDDRGKYVQMIGDNTREQIYSNTDFFFPSHLSNRAHQMMGSANSRDAALATSLYVPPTVHTHLDEQFQFVDAAGEPVGAVNRIRSAWEQAPDEVRSLFRERMLLPAMHGHVDPTEYDEILHDLHQRTIAAINKIDNDDTVGVLTKFHNEFENLNSNYKAALMLDRRRLARASGVPLNWRSRRFYQGVADVRGANYRAETIARQQAETSGDAILDVRGIDTTPLANLESMPAAQDAIRGSARAGGAGFTAPLIDDTGALTPAATVRFDEIDNALQARLKRYEDDIARLSKNIDDGFVGGAGARVQRGAQAERELASVTAKRDEIASALDMLDEARARAPFAGLGQEEWTTYWDDVRAAEQGDHVALERVQRRIHEYHDGQLGQTAGHFDRRAVVNNERRPQPVPNGHTGLYVPFVTRQQAVEIGQRLKRSPDLVDQQMSAAIRSIHGDVVAEGLDPSEIVPIGRWATSDVNYAHRVRQQLVGESPAMPRSAGPGKGVADHRVGRIDVPDQNLENMKFRGDDGHGNTIVLDADNVYTGIQDVYLDPDNVVRFGEFGEDVPGFDLAAAREHIETRMADHNFRFLDPDGTPYYVYTTGIGTGTWDPGMAHLGDAALPHTVEGPARISFHEGPYTRMVRYGFDKVISPAIRAIIRRPLFNEMMSKGFLETERVLGPTLHPDPKPMEGIFKRLTWTDADGVTHAIEDVDDFMRFMDPVMRYADEIGRDINGVDDLAEVFDAYRASRSAPPLDDIDDDMAAMIRRDWEAGLPAHPTLDAHPLDGYLQAYRETKADADAARAAAKRTLPPGDLPYEDREFIDWAMNDLGIEDDMDTFLDNVADEVEQSRVARRSAGREKGRPADPVLAAGHSRIYDGKLNRYRVPTEVESQPIPELPPLGGHGPIEPSAEHTSALSHPEKPAIPSGTVPTFDPNQPIARNPRASAPADPGRFEEGKVFSYGGTARPGQIDVFDQVRSGKIDFNDLDPRDQLTYVQGQLATARRNRASLEAPDRARPATAEELRQADAQVAFYQVDVLRRERALRAQGAATYGASEPIVEDNLLRDIREIAMRRRQIKNQPLKKAGSRKDALVAKTEFEDLKTAGEKGVSEALDGEVRRIVKFWRSQDDALRTVVETSARRAFNDSIGYIDDHNIRSQFAETIRNLVPFYFAEEQFMKRWIRTAIYDPASIHKLQVIKHGLESSGLLQRDPESGEQYFVYPGSGELNSLIGHAMEKVTGRPTVMPMYVPMTGQLRYALPGFDNLGVPAPGPLVSVPLSMLANRFPELRDAEYTVLGERAAGKGIVDHLMPTSVRRFWDAMKATPESSREMASSMMAAMAYMEASGHGLPDDASSTQVEVYLDRVENWARSLMLTRAIVGFTAPAAPSGDVPGKELSVEFKRALSDLPIDEAVTTFLAANPDATPFTVFQSETPSKAYIRPGMQTLNWLEANQDILGQYPMAAPWLVPQEFNDEPYSSRAYNGQVAMGVRERRLPEEYYREIKFAQAAPQYFDTKDEFERKIAALRVARETDAAQEQEAAYGRWRQAYLAQHPIFAEQLSSPQSRLDREKVVDQLFAMFDDPFVEKDRIPDDIREVLEAFGVYRSQMNQLKYQRGTRASDARQRIRLRTFRTLDAFTRKNPGARQLFLRVIRPDLEVDDVMAEVA